MLARSKLRHRGVAAIGTAERGAQAEPAFSEVQAVANRAADAVVGDPLDVRLVHASLVHEILRPAGRPGCRPGP